MKTDKKEKDKIKKHKISKKNRYPQTTGIIITEKWDLPSDLKEVSGIAYIDVQRFACIQDEAGTIFIYNRALKTIEREIKFRKKGDFEGITLNGNMAYVVRADGTLYELDMNIGKKSVNKFQTPLTIDQNVEGLCYDKNSDRLLLAIKDDELKKKNYKGIYAFDLAKKALKKDPVFKIDLNHAVFKVSGREKNKRIKPSEIGIHPITNEIFIMDGPKARLLIMDSSGNIKNLYELGTDFNQPEGITFSPDGEIYISNESGKQAANICKVKFQSVPAA